VLSQDIQRQPGFVEIGFQLRVAAAEFLQLDLLR
jgi:hypothetical protein